MSTDQIREICEDRFRGWMLKFTQDHATPLIALGIGHDQVSGQIVLCVVDEPALTNEVLAGMLRYAADQIAPRRG